MLIRCEQLNFNSGFEIGCRPYNFDSESYIRSSTYNSAANVNSLQTTQLQQQTPDSLIHYKQLNFGSEFQIRNRQYNFGSKS
jgi:hypothetical protein